jgi:Flp pilus assembly pilin Flp
MDFINTQIVKAQAALTAREEGQAMVEYGLVLALVSVVTVAVLTAIGGALANGSDGAAATDPIFNQIMHALGGTL